MSKTSFGTTDKQTIDIWSKNIFREVTRASNFHPFISPIKIKSASFTSKSIGEWNKWARRNQPIGFPDMRTETKKALGDWFSKQYSNTLTEYLNNGKQKSKK